ncbi:MAG: hypothetical protein WCP77_02300 [Roseococcus sp.]
MKEVTEPYHSRPQSIAGPLRHGAKGSPPVLALYKIGGDLVPVVIGFILEKVTNIPMGTEIDAMNEFSGALDVAPQGGAASKELAPAK